MIVASNRLRNVPEETDKQLFGSPSPIPQNRQGARKRGPQQVVHLILPRCFASVCAVERKLSEDVLGKVLRTENVKTNVTPHSGT